MFTSAPMQLIPEPWGGCDRKPSSPNDTGHAKYIRHAGKCERLRARFRFQAFSFLCTFVPGSEKTIERTFAPVELSIHGTNVPRTFFPMKLSYHENEYSKNFPSKCPKTPPFNLTIAYYALNETVLAAVGQQGIGALGHLSIACILMSHNKLAAYSIKIW